MTSSPDSTPQPHGDQRSGKPKKKKNRTHTPRPDELSSEVLEFIAAVDQYKRRNMRSFLEDEEVLQIVIDLGYLRSDCSSSTVTKQQLTDFASARQRYREDEGRLFPTWSELFELLTGLGYARIRKDPAA